MSSVAEARIWAVVLAGGVGSRFWPVSTPARPKQVLPLAGQDTLIRQTADRIVPLVPVERIRILTGAALADPMLANLPEMGDDNLWLEPQARGTAPVLAWAAHRIAAMDPGAVMVSLHADHVVSPAAEFRTLLAAVADASVRHGRLFTVGAVPDRPETGYGYIRPGARLTPGTDLFEVERFVEKPDRDAAEGYVGAGYLWNTGIFVWPAALLLEELRLQTPEVAEHLPLLDEDRVEAFFARVPTTTIDEGLLERSARVAVAAATFAWDDVGTWDAIVRTRETDSAGNVAIGDVHLVDSKGCVAWSEEGSVVVFGGHELVVVRSGGVTFVTPRERAPELKSMLARLPDRLVKPEKS